VEEDFKVRAKRVALVSTLTVPSRPPCFSSVASIQQQQQEQRSIDGGGTYPLIPYCSNTTCG